MRWNAAKEHREQVRARQAEDTGVTAAMWTRVHAQKVQRMQVAETVETVLETAAKDGWAHGHVELFLSGKARPGQEAEAAEFCRQKASEEGPDARDWSREAVRYQRMATVRAAEEPERFAGQMYG
jgi:hypothetical protein